MIGGGGGVSIFRKQQKVEKRSMRERGTAEGHSVLCFHEHFRTCEEMSFHIRKKILFPLKKKKEFLREVLENTRI